MIAYQLKENIIWKWLLIILVLLFTSYIARDIDIVRKLCIIGVAVVLLGGLICAFSPPTYFGNYLRINETKDGFDIEYLNKRGGAKKIEKIVLAELINFSVFDYSSKIITQTNIVLKSAEKATKLLLLHKKRVKGIELQTDKIVDMLLNKIEQFNLKHNDQFIERVPSFFTTKSGFYLIIATTVMIGIIIINSPAKTERIIFGISYLGLTVVLLMLRRYNELKEVAKSNKRL